MHPTPLPVALRGVAFTPADARALEVPAGRLRARDLVAPFHAVRAPLDAADTTIVERARLLLPRLTPTQVFTHSTAAAIHGIPLPASATHEPLHVGAILATREPRTHGVQGHRLRLDPSALTLIDGMPVPDAVTVWTQLGWRLRQDDLVIAADHLLGALRLPAEELAAAIRPGQRGAVALTLALEEARAGAESPQETRTRLVLVRSGLPEPDLNWTLRTPGGRFVARLDLAYPRWRTCIEYDGRQHADGIQFRRDADRWAEIENEGWAIVRVLAHHLDDPHRTIVPRVRRALAAHGWRA
ncbi:endonuclease domain-containing protein [Microbacterium sp. W1N]|uniref:endonuclease domain-containing protein n=1 Tax=Microbacterium festucae TaxID=2977531 RepID=UPI0021BFAAB5|nr:endonuclease domain-containing protein [Microbacterium festucae]MCT9820741.1 endonuclease domain-containing protein [Microbacterium festucae]